MPTDANGVYALPDGYLAVSGNTVLPSQHNPPLEDIRQALTERLSANGSNPMTGPLKLRDGSAAGPSWVFQTAQTTGAYKTASGNIGFAVSGVQVAEIGPGGIVKGGRYVGEIFDWTGSAAPPLCVLCYGQTLSRTAYPDLWTFAQAEIAAGNTLYNNGNGSTTFGIPDLRGRLRAAKDNMGGVAANRITTAGSAIDGSIAGSGGGAQNTTLLRTDLPNVAPPITVTDNHTHLFGASQAGNFQTGGSQIGMITPNSNGSGGASSQTSLTSVGSISAAIQSLNGGVTQTAAKTMPPTLITAAVLFAGA